ncbi:MAG: DNA (cytosine-5-)-methyltransferase, partial [Rhodobiaceae bacterium]|nr:DNA (cytosine-5-)-methyltransferase [Rhodobiaceae bacterium]
MKHVALFAGIGGFMYAAKMAGIENVWANELDDKCCETLELNFPDTQISRKSVAKLDTKDIHEIPDGIDLMTAGFPCQSFSQAGGSFKAFDDPRGKLFFDIPRVIGLMKAPPKVVLLENVPNLKIFDKGSLLRTVITEMKFAGYWVREQHAQILNSAEYGSTPQRRERLFVVCAHKKYFKHNPFDFSLITKQPRPPLFDFIDRKKMPGDGYYLSTENKYFKMIDKIASKEGRDRLFQIRRVAARACPPGICPTLTANMGDGGHNVPFVYDDFGLRRLTEDECLRMQGFDVSQMQFPDHLFAKDVLKMAGNAVSV